MTLQEMAAEAKSHWKQYPKTYKLMVKNGDLEKSAVGAAKLTQMEMNSLTRIGQTEAEAWQSSRDLFILTDPANHYNP